MHTVASHCRGRVKEGLSKLGKEQRMEERGKRSKREEEKVDEVTNETNEKKAWQHWMLKKHRGIIMFHRSQC